MTKNDYIEKITQNLEHLTKDELKDVATLTNAQFEVRLKVAEKEYWGKEIANLKSQLQQQALPVVPECVAEWYEGCAPIPVKTCITDFLFNYQKEKSVDDGTEFEQWFIRTDNSIEILMDMKRLGYEVEKPQLFYLKNKLTTSYLILDTSTGYFEHWGSTEATGRYKSSFTQSEIGSMETGSYEQIPVPVEDGE